MFGDDLAFGLQSIRIAVGSVLETLRGVSWGVFIPVFLAAFGLLALFFYNVFQFFVDTISNTSGFLSHFQSVQNSDWWRLVSYCASLDTLYHICTAAYMIFASLFTALAAIWISFKLSRVVPDFVSVIYQTLKRITGV